MGDTEKSSRYMIFEDQPEGQRQDKSSVPVSSMQPLYYLNDADLWKTNIHDTSLPVSNMQYFTPMLPPSSIRSHGRTEKAVQKNSIKKHRRQDTNVCSGTMLFVVVILLLIICCCIASGVLSQSKYNCE